MYGDHLYKKGDFDGSLRQYARTIGHVEPSYVIRRFLDAQRIHNLTTYLEALHTKAFANAEHTTLLLNCYTKLKDVKKLDRFIHAEEYPDDESEIKDKNKSDAKLDGSLNNTPGSVQSLTFDVETAISVLRDNYPQHALALAKKHEEHRYVVQKIYNLDVRNGIEI